jgi:hypothetical protein
VELSDKLEVKGRDRRGTLVAIAATTITEATATTSTAITTELQARRSSHHAWRPFEEHDHGNETPISGKGRKDEPAGEWRKRSGQAGPGTAARS